MALHRVFLLRELLSGSSLLSSSRFSLKYLSSTNNQKRSIYITNGNSKSVTLPSHEELITKLEVIVPELQRDITQEDDLHLKLPETAKRYSTLLEHFLLGGKHVIPLTVLKSYHTFVRNPSDADLKLAFIMAGCFKLYGGWIHFIDDIMDQSELRWGRPCWHRLHPEMLVGDGILLQNSIHFLLSKYFRDKSYYSNVLDLFYTIIRRVVLALHEETLAPKSLKNTGNLNRFTLDNYNALLEYKIVSLVLYLPTIVGMHMAGIPNPENQCEIREILHEMERLYQIQNDYSDCFGDLDKSLRTNNDIEQGMLTWPISTALQNSNDRQRAILEECYGKADKDKVGAVIDVYTEIGIPAIFKEFEEKCRNDILRRIQRLPQESHPEFFVDWIDRWLRSVFLMLPPISVPKTVRCLS